MVQRRRRSHHARRDRWAATGGPPQAVMVGMCGAPVGVRGRRGSMRRPCGAPGLPACRAAVGLWGPRRAMSVVDMMCSDGGEGRAIGQPSRCGASPACVRSAVRAGVGGFAAEVGIVCVSVSITPLYLVFGGGTGICFRSHHRAGGGPHAQRLDIGRSWCYPPPGGASMALPTTRCGGGGGRCECGVGRRRCAAYRVRALYVCVMHALGGVR